MNLFAWVDVCQHARDEFEQWKYMVLIYMGVVEDCCICLTGPTDARLWLCGHTIHAACFVEWMLYSRTCPLCRAPVA